MRFAFRYSMKSVSLRQFDRQSNKLMSLRGNQNSRNFGSIVAFTSTVPRWYAPIMQLGALHFSHCFIISPRFPVYVSDRSCHAGAAVAVEVLSHQLRGNCGERRRVHCLHCKRIACLWWSIEGAAALQRLVADYRGR